MNNLPSEIFDIIISFANIRDIFQLSATCKSLLSILDTIIAITIDDKNKIPEKMLLRCHNLETLRIRTFDEIDTKKFRKLKHLELCYHEKMIDPDVSSITSLRMDTDSSYLIILLSNDDKSKTIRIFNILFDLINQYYPFLENIEINCGYATFCSDVMRIAKKLKRLHMNQYVYGITDGDLAAMSETLISFKSFNNHSISDIGLAKLHNLTELMLGNNKQFSDKGIIELKNLQLLDIGDCKMITDKAIIKLQNLETLCLGANNKITDDAILSLPKLKIL